MSKTDKSGADKVRALLVGVGVVACLGGVAAGAMSLRGGSGAASELSAASAELGTVSQQIFAATRSPAALDDSGLRELNGLVARFEDSLASLQVPALNPQAAAVEVSWQPVKRATQVVLETGPAVVTASAAVAGLDAGMAAMQGEFDTVVGALQQRRVSAQTLVAAQKAPWLLEQMVRDGEQLLAGGAGSERAARDFNAASGEFIRIVEGLTRGDDRSGIERAGDAVSVEALTSAFRLFTGVASLDGLAGSADSLRDAARARDSIAADMPQLTRAIADLQIAVGSGAGGASGGLLASLLLPTLLAAGLLVALFLLQRRRDAYTAEGVTALNAVLDRISRGDLSAAAAEDHAVTGVIATGLNATTRLQRDLIRAIRSPFEDSIEKINDIGRTASAKVDKGKELTRAVNESADTATEMVRTSEDIKNATAEASDTSARNRQKVAQGYELTKDMSKASVDVRESVQETSKSAKRQSELIQSVTAAAEYIQALNTKISVVAINTRIEAEKAGEYGRPFLGIAESIADLLREAEEEGRKIISEVRMLQNMSADNLSSMENTVGTVVTILEYIDRLDSSLEEINSGSDAIATIIEKVDDAAGQSAINALHMNTAMGEIRGLNNEISELSQSTLLGVTGLKKSMRDASASLSQFRIDGAGDSAYSRSASHNVDELEQFREAARPAREAQAPSAMELSEKSAATL